MTSFLYSRNVWCDKSGTWTFVDLFLWSNKKESGVCIFGITRKMIEQLNIDFIGSKIELKHTI